MTQSFDALGLSAQALAAVAELGYEEPTPVQEQAIPVVLAGHDVMAAAQTGTGKTAAFLLPCLDQLAPLARGERGPHMLVVTPTRELAQQIEEVAGHVVAHTGHRVTTVVGGVGYEPQYKALRRGCDLLIATPGRLVDLIEQGEAQLGSVSVLVLDEADRMLDMGFLPQVRRIVTQLPDERQTLLFSATLDDSVLDHTRDLVRKPVRVEIAHKGTAAETIDQYVLPVSFEAKNALLPAVLKQEGAQRVIVFCRAKHRADTVCRRLRKAGISAAPIHGNRSQNQRERALASFRSGEVDVLVATDVLARGIDIADVAYVVNFDVPADPEDYIHRIGRTGRAGETGWALTFVTHDDYLDLRDIEALMGRTVPTWDKADGLDLGEEPPVLDPARNPHDKLPGKKERKRIKAAQEKAAAERREKARAQRREAGAAAATAASGVAAASAPVAASAPAAAKGKKRRHKKAEDRGAAPAATPAAASTATRAAAGTAEEPARKGGAKKAGRKGAQDVVPPLRGRAADLSGKGVSWGVRQRKSDGRRVIALDELKNDLADWSAQHSAAAAANRAQARAAQPKRNWRDIAAEIAGLTLDASAYELAPAASAPAPATGSSTHDAAPSKRKRRKKKASDKTPQAQQGKAQSAGKGGNKQGKGSQAKGSGQQGADKNAAHKGAASHKQHKQEQGKGHKKQQPQSSAAAPAARRARRRHPGDLGGRSGV